MAKYKAPADCPVCGGKYDITSLVCKSCKSELKGRFEGCSFCSLSDSDRYFISIFIKCRGNIKDVEKELGISYPTVRSKLDMVIKNLGFKVADQDVSLLKEEKKKIFMQLENNEISAEEAVEELKNIKGRN